MFCVASLDVIGYEELEDESGHHAAEQVNNFVIDICRKFIRDADRICLERPGHFLFLLPESDASGGKQALTRVAQTLAANRLQHKHQSLHVTCSFKVAYSGEYGSDAEALLAATGYRIAETGELIRVDSPGPSSILPGEGWEPFCGDFSVWSQRYSRMQGNLQHTEGEFLEVKTLTSQDHWCSDQQVTVRIMGPLHRRTIFDTTLLELIERRARVLQSIDHPHVTPLRDYHISKRSQLYVVRADIDAIPLLQAANHGVSASNILEWTIQICNGLIYLQSLIPPVVPPPLEECVYVVPDTNQIIFIDYEIPYLFPHWYQKIPVSNLEIEAALQGRPVAAYGPVIQSLSRLLKSLFKLSPVPLAKFSTLLDKISQVDLPRDLNTIYKIRSAVKEILDDCRLNLLTTEEAPHA